MTHAKNSNTIIRLHYKNTYSDEKEPKRREREWKRHERRDRKTKRKKLKNQKNKKYEIKIKEK